MNTTNMIVRIMTISDYEKVYALWQNTPNMGLNDIDDSREGIAKYLDRNPRTSFVAEVDGKIVGVILSGNGGRRGYIHHTAVAQNMQKHGIGTALVNAAMDALSTEGIQKCALVCFAKNTQGNDFWEKRGFSVRGDLMYRNKYTK